MPKGSKTIAGNPKARHDYEIIETFEAGLHLRGDEVKSAKAGQLSIKEAYVRVHAGEAWLESAYIKPYVQADQPAEATRSRKLLLHKHELTKLAGAAHEKGLTVIPLQAYLKRGFIKLEIAVGRGKKHYDKRQSLKARQAKREADAAIKQSHS